ncbi:hypothetical protein MKZ38_009881 [Zalerion maritima]|uniref:Uncharacterized protein n=1 Tax=Zalerion maritima TaxID=339359 RepID=A0AAD5RSY2_9PEZI|nr:hypothetical protein MKZ38_009881 [Zalerion maritima]
MNPLWRSLRAPVLKAKPGLPVTQGVVSASARFMSKRACFTPHKIFRRMSQMANHEVTTAAGWTSSQLVEFHPWVGPIQGPSVSF